jgi:hypothetical protein
VSGRKLHFVQILNKIKSRYEQTALLSAYFPPNYVQKIANTPEGQMFIKKLLDVYNLVPCNPHAKPYFLFKSHLVNCVALIECHVVDTAHQSQKVRDHFKYTQFRNICTLIPLI